MAVVLRSSSDLAYLADHGYSSTQGALRILLQLSPHIRRLDASHNLLGRDGVRTLINGIWGLRLRNDQSRLRYDETLSDEGEVGKGWGLTEIALKGNHMDDEGLEQVLYYAKLWKGMRKLWVSGNDIEVRLQLEKAGAVCTCTT
jgi:hypothetical protein